MNLNFASERVLAVVAHPDDAELLCAGTLARAKADGAAIGICILCRGDKGLPPGSAIRDIAAVRRLEAKASSKMLGAALFLAGYGDGTLQDGKKERLKLVEIYRWFRPTLVLAHSAMDYHADHRAASQLAEAASWSCASAGQRSRRLALGQPPALWWMDVIGMHGFQPGFYIDISAYAKLKERLLSCHRSQLARAAEAGFADLMTLMRQQFATRGLQAGVQAAETFQIHDAFKRARAW